MLRPKEIQEKPVQVEDLVQVFAKKAKSKGRKCNNNLPVLEFDLLNRKVTVSGARVHKMTVEIEVVRPSIRQDELAAAV